MQTTTRDPQKMPIFTRDEQSVLFIHIPKTGGTTVEDTFVNNGYEMTYRRGGVYGKRTAFDQANGCSPQHMHAALLDQHFAGHRFDHIFAVVRHPLRRFASEFRFRAAAGHPLAKDGIDAFARAVTWRFTQRNPMVLDNHIRPQTEFLWRDCTVLKLEDGIASLLARLSQALGTTLSGVDGLASMRSDSAIAAAPAPQTEEALRAFYRSDFEAFGYE